MLIKIIVEIVHMNVQYLKTNYNPNSVYFVSAFYVCKFTLVGRLNGPSSCCIQGWKECSVSLKDVKVLFTVIVFYRTFKQDGTGNPSWQ